MKKITSILIFLGISIGLVGVFFLMEKIRSSNNRPLEKIVLFYGTGCPHCVKVEEFIKENKIKEKINFEEKEVYFNKENQNLLKEAAKFCKIDEREIGVPFLWDRENGKCVVGDEPIINFFKEKLNL